MSPQYDDLFDDLFREDDLLREDCRADAEAEALGQQSCRVCGAFIGRMTASHRVTSIAQVDPPDDFWCCERCDAPLCEDCFGRRDGLCRSCAVADIITDLLDSTKIIQQRLDGEFGYVGVRGTLVLVRARDYLRRTREESAA